MAKMWEIVLLKHRGQLDGYYLKKNRMGDSSKILGLYANADPEDNQSLVVFSSARFICKSRGLTMALGTKKREKKKERERERDADESSRRDDRAAATAPSAMQQAFGSWHAQHDAAVSVAGGEIGLQCGGERRRGSHVEKAARERRADAQSSSGADDGIGAAVRRRCDDFAIWRKLVMARTAAWTMQEAAAAAGVAQMAAVAAAISAVGRQWRYGARAKRSRHGISNDAVNGASSCADGALSDRSILDEA
ncbi:hypothetical protein Scep_009771 [Stephania cephalantha]|uniref:Uncharacterized protein n=1 Tax=Stephania cephalantha TaxID=152367 RepID=A0AAP0JUT9_9MAGN